MQQYDKTVLDAPPNTDRNSWFRNAGWNADYGVEEYRKRYFGEISHLDSAVGHVLETLESAGLTEDTVVVFTSDHGDMAGCHGLFGKGVMFDESVRVPLFIRMPGTAVRVVDCPVSTVDLSATILDVAGVEPDGIVEGRSLIPYMNGKADMSSDVFIEYRDDCIISGDLKLTTERNEDDITACFDLTADPYETNNLAQALDDCTPEGLLLALNQWRNRTRS
jgi:choline-sulfatase